MSRYATLYFGTGVYAVLYVIALAAICMYVT